ncbi:MAG: hypothetical protein ACFE9L_09000 [Candidatus Hodarchaeota archaeon]
MDSFCVKILQDLSKTIQTVNSHFKNRLDALEIKLEKIDDKSEREEIK